MRSRTGQTMLLVAVFGAAVACGRQPASSVPVPQGFQFPAGDAMAGRETFQRVRCTTCHSVAGQGFPAPLAQAEAMRLTQETAKKTVDELAQSIVSPSHSISGDASGVAEGGELSRMGDFSQSLSVQDVADLVAFLKTIEGM
ncbi:MAG TPA: cytochrome c [Thermoanaerobaculia bacterium]